MIRSYSILEQNKFDTFLMNFLKVLIKSYRSKEITSKVSNCKHKFPWFQKKNKKFFVIHAEIRGNQFNEFEIQQEKFSKKHWINRNLNSLVCIREFFQKMLFTIDLNLNYLVNLFLDYFIILMWRKRICAMNKNSIYLLGFLFLSIKIVH